MKIPLILWGKTSPSHSITCITRCYNNSRIMTGSIEGQIGCWNIVYDKSQDKYTVQPFCIIFAHSCSIDDICLLSNKRMGINSCLVSLSNSGELCLWNSENGCCLNTAFVNTKFDKIYGICDSNADVRRQSLIICYGTHPEMQIFDPFSLEILYTLKQNCSWPNFLSTLCFCSSSNNLMAVTYSGVIKTWDLHDALQKRTKSQVIMDSNQYNLALQPDCIARCIVPNLTSNKHFLLVTSKQFFIYDSTKIIRLTSTSVQLQQSWAGGDFLGNNMVIMWDKNGTCYLFAISNDECETVFDSPLLYAIFHTNQCETGLSVTMLNHPYGCMNCFVIFQGCIGGRITYWRLPKIEDLKKHVTLWCEQINEMSEIFEEEGFEDDYQQIMSDHVIHMQATYITELNDNFNKLHPSNIINKIDNADVNSVCCSIFLTETGFIAAGRTNGNITLIPALQALCFEFLHSNNDCNNNHESNEYCNLVGHSKKITYLFYPYDEDDHYQPHHLLSGSADFTVRLWDIITLTQLSCFSYHAGLITKILAVPPSSNSTLSSSIVTMGSDHTVNVINVDTGKHIVQANSNNSPVQTVKWRIEEDLMLLGCGDGIVYIWQLSTGKLDRCVSGSLALEILESFNDDSETSHHTASSINNSINLEGSLSDKNRMHETKIYKMASSFATKFSKNHPVISNAKIFQLRAHRHHLHSNHHIHLSSLKKGKIKRRSFKLKSRNSFRAVNRSDRGLKDNELNTNSNFRHTSSSVNIPRTESRIFDITTTTLNMASQPLNNLQSVSAVTLNCPKKDSNEEYFNNPDNNNLTIENVSHTTNQYLPFNIISARTSYQDDDIHVLLFDPDAIIRTIHYLEETLKSIKNLRVCYQKKNFISTDDLRFKSQTSSVTNLTSMNLPSQILNNGSKNTDGSNGQNYSHMKSCFKYLSLAVAPPSDISDYSKYLAKHAYYHSKMIRDIIKILISALSAWGLDKNLDNICEQRLHLYPPVRSLCFGLISHGKLVAHLPMFNLPKNTPTAELDAIPTQSVINHWNSSKTMLTQHVVTIVSIAKAVLGAESSFLMDYVVSYSGNDGVSCEHSQERIKINEVLEYEQKSIISGDSSVSTVGQDQSQHSTNIIVSNEKSRFYKKTISYDSNELIASIKSGWNELANFYCFDIINHTFECEKQFHFRGVILHELIRHWLSFNSNIREASRSILLSELTRLGVKHASDLIQAWGYFLPENISFYDYIYDVGVTDQIPISYPAIQNSLVIESCGSYGYWPTPVHHRATLALYMICFVVCELFIPQSIKEFNLSALSNILSPLKLEAITRLLMESISLGPGQKIHYPTPTKRASVWLIGRGFKIFEQYIDFTDLIITLLDIAATSEIIMKYHSSKQPRASKIEYTKACDTWNTAQDTLTSIAIKEPVKFLTTIDSDIIKNVSNSNLLANISASSTAALYMYNIYINNYNKRISTPSSRELNYINDTTTPAAENALNILSIGAIFKKLIYQILNHIFEECYDEISPIIVEMFDVTLQCLSPKVFRGKTAELIRTSKMFSSPIVNYNEVVKKLAIGTKQGKIALYDVRTLKLNIFVAHDSEINFISFSNDGKYLVTFSKIDRHLKTWHSQFSLIGLINNPFKQHNNYLITHPDGYNKLLECLPTFEWNDSRHITIYLDQNQFSFVV